MHACRPRKVLVVAPGQATRGGITSVVRLHTRADVWQAMNCRLLATHDDRGKWHKMIAALKAYIQAPGMVRKSSLVHVHLAGQMSLLRKLPIIALAKMMRRPLILHVHALSPESLFTDTPRWAFYYAFKSADLVIALSQSWAELIRQRSPASKVAVVQNPVLAHSCKVPLSTDCPMVLFVGKLEERKGYADLIQAAKIVHDALPNVQFWFAGHGELEKAGQLAKTLGLEHRIRLLGWMEEESLAQIWKKATIFCLPSHNEGVPMAVLEAMSHGVPVVCTPVGGLPELIEDGRNGLFTQPANSGSISDAILSLLQDEALRKSIGEAGYLTVQQKCGLETVSDRLKLIYQELLCRK